jgi:hypothetical protein
MRFIMCHTYPTQHNNRGPFAPFSNTYLLFCVSVYAHANLSQRMQVVSLEAQVKQHLERISELSEASRHLPVVKHSDAEQALRRVEIDLEAAKREKDGFESAYKGLSQEVADLRVKLKIMETDHESEKRASYAPSPARSLQLQHQQHLDNDSTQQVQERIRSLENQLQTETLRRQQAEDRVKQVEAELARVRAYADDANVDELQRQLAEAKARLSEAQWDKREMEMQVDQLREREEMATKRPTLDDGAGTGELQRELHERNVRMRQLLKENAEWRAQVRQLSTEVVGLTEALEMVTKRAQDKDAKHAELQKKTDRILRLAGLVDPALAIEAQQNGAPVVSKKKKIKGTSRARNMSASPARGRSPPRASDIAGGTPPRYARESIQSSTAWQDGVPPSSYLDDPNLFPVVLPRRTEGTLRPSSAGRQRPHSARARIEMLDQDNGVRIGAQHAWGETNGVGRRMEYLPPATRMGEPLGTVSEIRGMQARRPLSATAAQNGPPRPPETPPPTGGSAKSWRLTPQDRGGEGFMSVMPAEHTLRPFSHFVRAVQDGTITTLTPMRIIVEVCNSEHYSRRHDIIRYQQLYDKVAAAMYDHLRGRVVLVCPNGKGGSAGDSAQFEPRPGAFEVCVEWSGKDGATHTVVLFSKLETMRYPNPAQLAARLNTVLAGGEDPEMYATPLVGEVQALP